MGIVRVWWSRYRADWREVRESFRHLVDTWRTESRKWAPWWVWLAVDLLVCAAVGALSVSAFIWLAEWVAG